MTEAVFLNTYGSPLLQAMVGLGAPAGAHRATRRAGPCCARRARRGCAVGAGAPLRGGRPGGGRAARADLHPPAGRQRRRTRLRRAAGSSARRSPADKRMSLARFKEMLREQYLLVRLDEERAVARHARSCCRRAMTPRRKAALDVLRRVLRRARRAARTRASAAWRGSKRCSACEPQGRQDGGGPCLTTAPSAAGRARQVRAPDRRRAQAPADDQRWPSRIPATRSRWRARSKAARLRLIEPILVGPQARIRDVAARAGLDIAAFEIVDSRAQPRFGGQGGGAGHGRPGRGPDEGQPPHRRTDGRGGGARQPASAPRGASATASSWTCRAIPIR